MAVNQTRRLTTNEVEGDDEAIFALRQLSDYTPINTAYSVLRLDELDAAFVQANQEERRLLNALAAARDAVVAASWARHNAVLGAKAQVIAQYGPDSNAVQSLGLKKKSERRRPARRTSTSDTVTT